MGLEKGEKKCSYYRDNCVRAVNGTRKDSEKAGYFQ